MNKDELKQKLTEEQYHITQEKGTELPFTGKLLHNKETGIYNCIVCGAELFRSDEKYDSGSGWPSFYDVISQGKVKLLDDFEMGTKRTEVQCANCGAHLGHVFNDGPKEKTGLRYCINSSALNFSKKVEDNGNKTA